VQGRYILAGRRTSQKKSIDNPFIDGNPQFDEVLFMDHSCFGYDVVFFDLPDRADGQGHAIDVQMMITCSPAYGSEVGDKDGGKFQLFLQSQNPPVYVHEFTFPYNNT